MLFLFFKYSLHGLPLSIFRRNYSNMAWHSIKLATYYTYAFGLDSRVLINILFDINLSMFSTHEDCKSVEDEPIYYRSYL